MRNNHEGGEFRQFELSEGMKIQPFFQTLTATFIGDFNMPTMWYLDPGGAGRTVLLPPEVKGGVIFISNEADAAEALTVKEDANVTTIAVLSQGQSAWFYCGMNGAVLSWRAFAGLQGTANLVEGAVAGIGIARGQATTVAASDTIVTGLTGPLTSVVAGFDDDPVAGAMHVTASIGNQAGAPASGSFLLKTWKSTDATALLVAATTFGKKMNWIATGPV